MARGLSKHPIPQIWWQNITSPRHNTMPWILWCMSYHAPCFPSEIQIFVLLKSASDHWSTPWPVDRRSPPVLDLINHRWRCAQKIPPWAQLARQFSIWKNKFNSVWSSSRPNKIRKYEVPSSQSIVRQFLSSKQYFVGFMTSWYWISALSRWRLYMCAYLTESCVVFLQKQQALCLQFQPVHPVAIASAFWLGIFLECTCCCSWHENQSDPTHLS